MLFPTIAFAVFFVVVFVANWLLRPRYRIWQAAMIVASFYFYFRATDQTSLTDWIPFPMDGSAFVLLLAASIAVNWAFGQVVHVSMRRSGRPALVGSGAGGGEDGGGLGGAGNSDGLAAPLLEKTSTSRGLVIAAVVVNLGVLGYFKYYEWFASDVVELINGLPFPNVDPPLLEVILPIGISFFTFQALSYVIDIGRGDLTPMKFGDFALYLSFFPQLVAGPIVRATEFKPQLRNFVDPRHINSAEAFRLIFRGLFKKVVVSSFLASEIVDPVFAVPGDHSSLEVLFAIWGYAIQIYADFSGYTDIAIGCALLLGFRFPQNFDSPYRALSIQDFWHRWHMTLSRWLRDYLYIPLGGNRKGHTRTQWNLMITMLLGGLWHGASWTFLIWGGIHGTALILERVVSERWKPIGLPKPAVTIGKWLLTFNVVCLAWVFFRAENLGHAFEMLAQLFTGFGLPSTLVSGLLVLTIGLMLLSQLVPEKPIVQIQDAFSRLGLVWQGIAVAVGITLIDTLGPEGVAPFIYFQF